VNAALSPSKRSRLTWIGAWWLTLSYMAVVQFLTSTPRLPRFLKGAGIDKLEHFLAYCVMGLLVWRSFYLRRPGASNWWLALATTVVAGIYAVADELHQRFIPGRFCEWQDLVADWIGVAVALVIVALWEIATKRRDKT